MLSNMNWKFLDVDIGCSQPVFAPKKKPALGVDDALLIGAGISAVGGIASSLFSSSSNADLDNVNRQWQERMWHESNQYNAPVEQRKRMEAAGINPALAFQSGNTGVAASSPTPNQHSPQDFSALGSGFQGAGQMIAQRASIKQMEQQTELLQSQKTAQDIVNRFTSLEKIVQIDKMIAEKEKIGADTSFLKWQLDRSMALFDAEQKKAYHDILALDARANLDNANAYIAQIDGKFRELQNKANLNFTNSQIRHVQTDIQRIVAETGVLSEKKLYQILENAGMLPDVKKALRISERMDSNPNETVILDALGLWLDPVTEAIDAGTKVSNARSSRIGARAAQRRSSETK